MYNSSPPHTHKTISPIYMHACTYYYLHTGSRNISSLTISCSKSSEGCDWMGELRVKDDHMTTCEYELVECENNCHDDYGETTKILRKDLETHLQEKCPKRIVQCELCLEEDEYHIITGEHLEEDCPEVLMECNRGGCEEMVKRFDCMIHYEVCEYVSINCKYEPNGCYVKLLRKDMPEHEQDLKTHLEVALETNTGLKKRLDTLEESSKIERATLFGAMTKMDQNMQKIQGAKRQLPWPSSLATLDSVVDNERSLAVATFKMENVQSHIQNKTPFYSPPFYMYTSPGGYSMKVKVQATKNHLSIYLTSVDGENDDPKAQPFQPVEIEVQILNQKSDVIHLSTSILKTGRYKYEGNRKAMAIRKLLDKYTLNDTLYFRVIVHRTPTVKPWLVCTV